MSRPGSVPHPSRMLFATKEGDTDLQVMAFSSQKVQKTSKRILTTCITIFNGYFQILIDTWLGYFIYPMHRKVKRYLIVAMPKFYFFDVGIANYLRKQAVLDLKGEAAGKSFEHYILMELIAYRGLNKKRF